MNAEIIVARCVGCERCCSVCPGSLIRLGADKRVSIPCLGRCQGCASYIRECPMQATVMSLGKDMSGLDGRLTVRWENALPHWTVTNPDGSAKTITIDSRGSNQYQE